MIKARTAKFQIGQIVRHRVFSFRGVIFDIDPEFNNTEEWCLSISRPDWPERHPRAGWLPASCGLLRRASAVLPAASSDFPRTPSDRWAGHRRLLRIPPPAAAAASAVRRWS